MWVHRWTAEGLVRLVDASAHRARHGRAGRYRMWRVEHESHSLEDAVEAVRNFMAGHDFDAAVGSAQLCFAALRRFGQSVGIAALASEVLESLPVEHARYAGVADEEAQAHLALGFTERARTRYAQLLDHHERLAAAEPDRADYQHDLVVSLARAATTDDLRAEERLLRALSILETMKGRGGLNPVDEPMIAALQQLLRERGLIGRPG